MDDQQPWRRRTLLRRAGTSAFALTTLGAARPGAASTVPQSNAADDRSDHGSDPAGAESDPGAVLALQSTVSAGPARWPQFQADPANSGFTDALGPDEASTAWTFDTGSTGRATAAVPGTATPTDGSLDDPTDNVVSSPAVVDGTVYVGSNDGHLYALDAASGEQEWAYGTGSDPDSREEVMSSPAVVDGTVYVGSHDAALHAVDAESGDEQWTFATDGTVFASPTYRDGTLYVGSQAGTMYAVDTAGEEVWSASVADRVDSTAAVVDDTVYVGRWNDDRTGSVVALDAADGEEVRTYAARAEVACSPTVTDGVVYFGDYTGVIYAIDTGTAELVWGRQLGGPVLASPVVVDGTVYVGSFDESLWALDAANGDIEWSYATDGRVYGSPAITGDTVYVGSEDTSLYAIDRESGRERFAVETDGEILSSPAVVAGAAFVGSSDSFVYAVGDPTGGESVSATPPGGTDGSPSGTADSDGPAETTAGDGPGFGAVGALAGLGLGAWHRMRAGSPDDTGPGETGSGADD
ncbi:PQQ-binding-like beta-propeller repeat protein [Halosimplex litoreum]|uniref:PQQ-binding-like beta-propeller repeat protein n=1 Tax=Halosimplex litoreum TaxID=1198301 RepID=A0A7T3FWD3_9EURY|nr:PQQ-binding-like beta-propeller repeat protein [Halosimplex litoreum]QPV61847.1 PQQ-binding-like beta-propeller repeat protein [Halosimplex litoreum]